MPPLPFLGSPRTAGAGSQSRLALRLRLALRPRDVLRLALLLERFRAADDVEQLLGDLLLARLVVLDREDLDHFLGVLRRGFYRGHARAVFAGERLHERAEDLDADVPR